MNSIQIEHDLETFCHGVGANDYGAKSESAATTAIYTEASIRQLLEVHAPCHRAERSPGEVPTPPASGATVAP